MKAQAPPVAAVYSLKGGVGKTTCAVSLAYLAAASGQQVMLWDLDPQGAATYCMRIRPKVKGGASTVVSRTKDLGSHLRETDVAGLDLMPADFSYRKLDALLAQQDKPRTFIGRAVEALVAARLTGYDLVVLDCPPGPSLVLDSVLRLATVLIVPMIPTPLSLRAKEQLNGYCRKRGLASTAVVPFFSMVDCRKKLHRHTVAGWCEEHGPIVQVPYSAQVENMALKRAPFLRYAIASPAGQAFSQLYQEVASRIRLHSPPPGAV